MCQISRGWSIAFFIASHILAVVGVPRQASQCPSLCVCACEVQPLWASFMFICSDIQWNFPPNLFASHISTWWTGPFIIILMYSSFYTISITHSSPTRLGTCTHGEGFHIVCAFCIAHLNVVMIINQFSQHCPCVCLSPFVWKIFSVAMWNEVTAARWLTGSSKRFYHI